MIELFFNSDFLHFGIRIRKYSNELEQLVLLQYTQEDEFFLSESGISPELLLHGGFDVGGFHLGPSPLLFLASFLRQSYYLIVY